MKRPARLAPSTWLEHVPFAMCLVDIARPRVVVELGVYYGVSYCAFCQAVKELNIKTECSAIDTWKGDPQGGVYGLEVLTELRRHHDPIYGSFSRLIQSDFAGALPLFESGSIDLLHIDGYHTYDAVKQDYESWLPKMSVRGIILFHDIGVREKDFGVWRLWEELKQSYPGRHFEFEHGCGLGLIAVGPQYPTALETLFQASDEDTALIRGFFQRIGSLLVAERDLSVAVDKKYESHLVRLARVFSAGGALGLIKLGRQKLTRVGRNRRHNAPVDRLR